VTVSPDTDQGPERLSDRQYAVLLLRLFVDAEGEIVYGDAGGPEEHDPMVERWVHFRGPDALLEAVRAWLGARVNVDTNSWNNPREGFDRS
jgi:hypothetical protein